MGIIFFEDQCKSSSKKRVFGICDDVEESGNTSKPAYLDEQNGQNWIATVENHYGEEISFYAIDNCIEFPPNDAGNASKRCDGFLTFQNNIAFVELKSRNEYGSKWIYDAEKQLRTSIHFFEKEKISSEFKNKRAYISNNMRPQSRASQAVRMERFLNETGYVLSIKARIDIYELSR